MDFLADWWSSQTPFLQFFYFIGIVSFFALVLQSLLLIIGMDGDSEVDFSDHSEGLGVVSVRTITAFFVGFGWVGVLVLEAGGSVPVAVAVALVAGAALMFAVHLVFKKLLGLQTRGNVSYANSAGQVATVYVTIPPAGAIGGQVEMLVQGRVRFVQAMTNGEEPIAPGTKVRVVSSVDTETVMVERLSASA